MSMTFILGGFPVPVLTDFTRTRLHEISLSLVAILLCVWSLYVGCRLMRRGLETRAAYVKSLSAFLALGILIAGLGSSLISPSYVTRAVEVKHPSRLAPQQRTLTLEPVD